MTSPVTLVTFPVSGDYQSPDDPEPSSSTSDVHLESVTGLVVFTPRLPKGFQAFLTDYEIANDSNCQQTVNILGAITGGTFALEFAGIWTAPIPAACTATQLQAALQACPSIGTGNVTVTAVTPNPGYPSFQAQFVGALGNAPQPQMDADPTNLTSSSGTPAVSVIMLNGGSTSRTGPTAITLPVRHGRIWTTGQLCSINVEDSPNVELVSNMPEFELGFELIYDVTFTNVSYNDVGQTLAPFGFVAPADSTLISITDPTLERLTWVPPNQETWHPGWTPTVPENVVSMQQCGMPAWRPYPQQTRKPSWAVRRTEAG